MSAAAATSPSKTNTLKADFAAYKKDHIVDLSSLKLEDGVVTGKLIEGKFEFVLDCSNYPQESLYLDGNLTYKGTFEKFGDRLIEDLEKAAKKSKKAKKGSDSDSGSFGDVSDGSEAGSDLRESGGWRTDSNASYDAGDEPINELRWQDNESLMLDLHNFKVVYGDSSINVRGMPLLELVEIDMSLSITDVLSAQTASAWGVDTSSPVVIRVAFNDTHYTDMHKPTQNIEIFQLEGNKRHKCGVSAQLENILRNFLKDYWPSSATGDTHATKLDAAAVKEAKKNAEHQGKGSGSRLKRSGFFSWVFGGDKAAADKDKSTKAASPQSTTPQKKEKEIDIAMVKKLVDMGFSEDAAFKALVDTKNNLQAATDLLLEGKKSKGAGVPTPSSTKVIQCHGVQVTYEWGFLVMMFTYLRERLGKLNEACVICDQSHLFATGNMLKPAVCSRELCCWSFQQLKVGADSAEDVATEAEVIDLLLSMATIAAKSARKELIFNPFPVVFDPAKPDKPVLSDAEKDWTLVNSILGAMPSVEQLVQSKDSGELKSKLDSAHRLAHPLMQWITSSNRAHIVKLQSHKIVKSMGTPHQYLLLSAAPEKEERFRELKAKHGSTFAYHGSSIENWHSIMRRGLVNASGTSLQVNGAAYGNGIYLSPQAATSFGYSRAYYNGSAAKTANNGNRFLKSGDQTYCIAICEVIDHDIRKSGTIWVQPHEDHVVTRFFCVYTDPSLVSGAQQCSTENATFKDEILNALNYYAGEALSQ